MLPPDGGATSIAFDFAAADAAIARLNDVKRYLNSLASVRATSVDEPRVDWSGRFRDDFDREFTSTQAELTGLAGSVSNLVLRIEQAKVDAGRAKAALECKPGKPC